MSYVLKGRELESRAAAPGDDEPAAPCIFCGQVIKHFNDGGVGWTLGAVVDGKPRTFHYCDQPPCQESLKAYPDPADPASNVWRCGCTPGSSYLENVGTHCHACGRHRDKAAAWE